MMSNVFSLDIFDLNYAYDERMDILSKPLNALPKAGIWVRFFSFIWHLFDGLLHLDNPFVAATIPKGSILFFVYTANQRNALQLVVKETLDGYLVGHYNLLVDQQFPVFWAYFVAIPFLPLVFWHYFKANSYQKKTFRHCFDHYWLTYGYYIMAYLWLKRFAPSALVVSNDHNMPHRVMAKAAHELHIPTVYLQHASVTPKFPPLSFDYALLDGIDALKKYDQIGHSQATVFLVGVPKLDAYFESVNQNAKVHIIGICTNGLDPLTSVEKLCAHIRNMFPNLPIIIRPHPGDRRIEDWQKLAQRYQADFSDSRAELSFEFLNSVDAVIVGESNILLEAALVNVYPLFYDFAQEARDHYGFIKNGLTQYSSQPEEISEQLKALLKSKPDVQTRAKNYCATVGTSYAGHSSKLAGSLIHRIASRRQINMDMWKKIPTSKLEAYALASD